MFAVLLASVFSAIGDWITEATDWLADFSANWWFVIIIFVVAYLDSVFPIVPSETMVIIGGVAAGQGEQSVLFVILAGATGAFLGDNTAYLIGARMSGFIQRQADKRPKWHRRLEWADAQIRLRGGILLITARFIPGGRTVLTLSCGITHQPRRWFILWTAVAALLWATYGAALGYFGGKTFEEDHTKAFLVAFGAALSVTIVIELVRHLRSRHRVEIGSQS